MLLFWFLYLRKVWVLLSLERVWLDIFFLIFGLYIWFVVFVGIFFFVYINLRSMEFIFDFIFVMVS